MLLLHSLRRIMLERSLTAQTQGANGTFVAQRPNHLPTGESRLMNGQCFKYNQSKLLGVSYHPIAVLAVFHVYQFFDNYGIIVPLSNSFPQRVIFQLRWKSRAKSYALTTWEPFRSQNPLVRHLERSIFSFLWGVGVWGQGFHALSGSNR